MRAGHTRSACPKGKIGGLQAQALPQERQGRALLLTLPPRWVRRCVRALSGRFRCAAARDVASHPGSSVQRCAQALQCLSASRAPTAADESRGSRAALQREAQEPQV